MFFPQLPDTGRREVVAGLEVQLRNGTEHGLGRRRHRRRR
jgi:hypothetical protein